MSARGLLIAVPSSAEFLPRMCSPDAVLRHLLYGPSGFATGNSTHDAACIKSDGSRIQYPSWVRR